MQHDVIQESQVRESRCLKSGKYHQSNGHLRGSCRKTLVVLSQNWKER